MTATIQLLPFSSEEQTKSLYPPFTNIRPPSSQLQMFQDQHDSWDMLHRKIPTSLSASNSSYEEFARNMQPSYNVAKQKEESNISLYPSITSVYPPCAQPSHMVEDQHNSFHVLRCESSTSNPASYLSDNELALNLQQYYDALNRNAKCTEERKKSLYPSITSICPPSPQPQMVKDQHDSCDSPCCKSSSSHSISAPICPIPVHPPRTNHLSQPSLPLHSSLPNVKCPQPSEIITQSAHQNDPAYSAMVAPMNVSKLEVISQQAHNTTPVMAYPSPAPKKSCWRKSLGSAANSVTALSSKIKKCNTFASPNCDVCQKQVKKSYVSAIGRKFHPECFKCIGCNERLDLSDPITYCVDTETGKKQPMHLSCFVERNSKKCVVCSQNLKGACVTHSFFKNEVMCACHDKIVRQCISCKRAEPKGSKFKSLENCDHCICNACARTEVIENYEAQLLWEEVLDFFEKKLNLPVWKGMRAVPVELVSHDALNKNKHGTRLASCNSVQSNGRSPSQITQPFDFEGKLGNIVSSTMPELPNTKQECNVTSIFCLRGLPYDLTASILAHEAMDAWLKIYLDRSDGALPFEIRKGCCQLACQRFLSSGLTSLHTVSEEGPSDNELRKCFEHLIEYGEGFYKAKKACEQVGKDSLLKYVMQNITFPLV